jgi:hypothetical protein
MPKAQVVNPWLISYITQQRQSQSRYEIDSYLLEVGYDPVEIELAWQRVKQPDQVFDAQVQPNRTTRAIYLVVGIILIIQFAFMLIDFRVSFYGGMIAFLIGLRFIIQGLAPVPHSRRVKFTLIILTVLTIFFAVVSVIYYLIR